MFSNIFLNLILKSSINLRQSNLKYKQAACPYLTKFPTSRGGLILWSICQLHFQLTLLHRPASTSSNDVFFLIFFNFLYRKINSFKINFYYC